MKTPTKRRTQWPREIKVHLTEYHFRHLNRLCTLHRTNRSELFRSLVDAYIELHDNKTEPDNGS